SKRILPRDNWTLFVLYEGFLAQQGVDRPSNLGTRAQDFRTFEIVTFLRHVCLPEIMDSSVSFSDTNDVERERIAICQILTDLDARNAAVYAEEISRLRQAGAIRRAIHEVDSSKVYVDIQGVRRTLEKSVRENFDRLVEVSRLGGRSRRVVLGMRLEQTVTK